MYQVPLYQVYKEDQDQISGATYISDVVFFKQAVPNEKRSRSTKEEQPAYMDE